jgi:uncharacterized protein YggU (UPF0235/DUF167 family)
MQSQTYVLLTVRAKPGSRRPGLRVEGLTPVVAVRERALAGAANDAVVRAVAEWLGVAPSRVALERGAAARTKRLRIDGVSEAQLAAALEGLPS